MSGSVSQQISCQNLRREVTVHMESQSVYQILLLS